MDLVRAYAAGIEGDPDTMDRLADRVAARLAEGTVTERVTTRSDEPPLLRAYAAMLRGDFDRCEAELARIDGERMMMRSRPMWRCVVGIVAFWLGVPARDTLEGAEAFARSDGVPYAVVLVSLDDAPELRVVGNMPGVPIEDIRIGMAVEAIWEERHADDGAVILLPQWQPASG